MVFDKIENSKLYTSLSEDIAKGLAFIVENDLAQLEPGKYEIDKDNVLAIVQEYETKDEPDGKLEGHFQHIDIQYMIEGEERMGIKHLKDQIPYEKNMDKDVAFYKDDCSFIKAEKGMFAIFYPEDLHMPCINSDTSSQVKKLVIKIKV